MPGIQLPISIWHDALGEPTIADGILDRLLEHVHRIELQGESMRRNHPQATTMKDSTNHTKEVTKG